MRRLFILSLVLSLAFLVQPARAATAVVKKATPVVASAGPSLSGTWTNPANKNSVVVFSQKGQAITGTSSWIYKGKHAVWQGTGTRNAQKVSLNIYYTLNPMKWPPSVHLDLTLSPDGKKLSGVWKNTAKKSGTVTFVRS